MSIESGVRTLDQVRNPRTPRTRLDAGRLLRMAALGLLLFAPGCREQKLREYQVPRETSKAAPAAMSDTAPSSRGNHPAWTTPSDWTETDSDNLRVARYTVPGSGGDQAEVGVMALSGGEAGSLTVVNIYREHLGLTALTAEDLGRSGRPLSIGRVQGTIHEMVSTTPPANETSNKRVLVAFVPQGGTTWAFKLSGPDKLVQARREEFRQFLGSVQLETDSGLPPGHPPIGGGGMPDNMAANAAPDAAAASGSGDAPDSPGGSGGAAGAAWTVPAGWEERPPTQMLLAKFAATGNGAGPGADITVSRFPGATGGLLANVNRWRGQLGLAPVDDSGLGDLVTGLDLPGGKASLVEMSGVDAKTNQPVRLVGIVAPRGDQTWFFKLVGSEAAARRERAAFLQFVKSVRFSNA